MRVDGRSTNRNAALRNASTCRLQPCATPGLWNVVQRMTKAVDVVRSHVNRLLIAEDGPMPPPRVAPARSRPSRVGPGADAASATSIT